MVSPWADQPISYNFSLFVWGETSSPMGPQTKWTGDFFSKSVRLKLKDKETFLLLSKVLTMFGLLNILVILPSYYQSVFLGRLLCYDTYEEEQSQRYNKRTMCSLKNFSSNKNVWFFVSETQLQNLPSVFVGFLHPAHCSLRKETPADLMLLCLVVLVLVYYQHTLRDSVSPVYSIFSTQ